MHGEMKTIQMQSAILADPPLITNLKRDLVQLCLDNTPENVTLDMSGVLMVASSWLGCLIELRNATKHLKGKMKIINLGATAYKMHLLARMESIFELHTLPMGS